MDVSFYGAGGESKNMYTSAMYMRQISANKPKCEFHRMPSKTASFHYPRFAYMQYA